MRYLVPVLVVSIMINASKFFEAYVAFEDGEYNIRLASFRRNTTYSGIMNWIRFLLIGILPLGVIIFLYVKVYKDILERKRTQFLRQNPRPRNSSIINVSTSFGTFILELAEMCDSFVTRQNLLLPFIFCFLLEELH